MAKTIIEVNGLTKRYGAVTAVDNLTLSVQQGEVFGLLGPNGAGKTTTTLMLLGLTEPTEGSAAIEGVDCTRDPIRVKRAVGYLPDNMGFYPDMTGRENLRMTGKMNGLRGEALETRIDELLERMGMTAAADRRASTYSKGMKQRLGIADILLKDPDVLILDEPTNGVDPEGIRELTALIRELADRDGRTILISSHQLHQIQQICDRVGIFVKGRLAACGRIEELAEQLEKENGYCFAVEAQPGGEALAAALKGAGEIGFTIISLTFSLIAVLIPLLFMGDIVGRLFREFAITLAVAILISAVVSLTLTPMMCARMLSQESLRKQNRFSRASEKMFERIIAAYGRGLAKVLNHPWLTLSVALSTLLLSVLLWVFIPKGFFPVQDNGIIQGTLQAPQSSSFTNMAQRQRQVADVILQDPAVQSLTSFVGVDGTNPSLNSARLQINLKPLDERDDRVQKVIARLQTAVDKVPGVDLFLQPTQDLTIDTQVSRTQYQFTLQATSLDALSTWVPQLMEKLQQLPQLSDVSSDWQDKGLVAYVNVDRDSASRLGINMADVDNALYNAFGQRLISTIYTQANQYRVVLEHNTENTPGLAALDTIRLTSSDGGVVPLSSIAKIEQRFAPLSINHLDQFPVTTISFNVPDNYSLGDAVQAIMDTEKTLNLPVDITTQFQGSTLAFQSALGSTVWLIVAAVVAMYIVLGILYESFIHPITILSTLPTAGVGALLALLIAGSELDVIAIIGIILLIGIVKKNAIMMIDFALAAEREQGMSPRDAIYQACLLRFRPILMTTLAALLGALPLMLSTGVGAELRRPLGIGMVGGLIVSQVLTLFTTPVIYLLFDRLALWTKSRFARHEEEA